MAESNMESEQSEDQMERTIEFYLEAFQPEICKYFNTDTDLKKLILNYEPFNNRHDEKRMLMEAADMEKEKPFDLFCKIIDTIKKMETEPSRYTALVSACRKIGHEKASLILTGVALPTNETHRKLILKCGADICNMLNVIDVLPYLEACNIISDTDRQVFVSTWDNKGNWHAAFKLLNCLPNKQPDWYVKFMEILLKTKHMDLAQKINSELEEMWKAGEDTCISMVANDDPFLQPSTSRGSSKMEENTEYSSVREDVMTDYAEAEPMNDVDAPPPVPKRFDSLQEESDKDEIMEKECDIKSELRDSVPAESLEEIDLKLDHQGSSQTAGKNDEDDDDDDDDDDDGNYSSDYEESADAEDSSSQLLKLRDYQLELAENAVAGRNTVICAGTGSGKTWVALHIVKEHFKKADGPRKVVFMARTSALIKQQADRFKRYLKQYQSKLITGENEASSSVGIFLEFTDILCFTPQILVNNLETKSVKSLSEFSLMILDECHHTKKDEPYNTLMRKYLIEKTVDKRQGLPQIVGLTASIGVGKSHNDEDACDYMLHLFASMDVRLLSTVQRCTEEYNKYSSQATEELVQMIIPRLDPCKDLLVEAIVDTEDKLEDFTLMIPDMIDIMAKCPSDKQSQEYNKWTVEVEKGALHNIRDDEIYRNVRTCAIYLNVYNAALEVNSLLGPQDVMKFLANKHKNDMTSREKLTEDERKLLDNLLGVQKKIQQHRTKENPNVRKMCNILKSMIEKNVDESRAMVFVKARATCIALKDFLKKDFHTMGIGVYNLYGKENRGGLDGMTESVQNETVERFRRGEYKILVATSVGMEGIDVPDCNIVLNYNFLGNEITKIQMKGRSRKKEGHNVIMGSERHIEHERVNAYKIAMMQRALKIFLSMDPKIVERKINLYQQEDISSFRFKKEVERSKRSRKSTEADFQIHCGRCNVIACCTSDIRMVKCQYIVIDGSFKDRIKLKPHKSPKKFDGFHKKFKMFCKKCPLDWGIVSENKGLTCYTLKLECFKLYNMKTGVVEHFKKWDDVPVVIQEIQVEDLPRLLGDSQ